MASFVSGNNVYQYFKERAYMKTDTMPSKGLYTARNKTCFLNKTHIRTFLFSSKNSFECLHTNLSLAKAKNYEI